MYHYSVLWSGKYTQCWDVLPHCHSYYQIIVSLKNGGEILIGGQHYPLTEHQVFLIHPNAEHAIPLDSARTQLKFLDIKFTVQDDQLAGELSQLPPSLSVGNFSLFQNLFGQILRESAQGGPYSYDCVCHYFGLLLVQLLRTQATGDVQTSGTLPAEPDLNPCYGADIPQIVQFIQQNYASPITLDDLSRIVSVSKSTLIQAFKTVLNTTPIQYINHIRLTKAKELLLSTDSSISEISEMVGFQSLHYFSRYFKTREQLSPIEYRQRYSSSHFYTYRQPNSKEDPELF